MALKRIELSDLVDLLDEAESDFANFFRPMLGFEALLKLYDGACDYEEPLVTEIEDETGCQFPTDLLAFYMCTNGGTFADLDLFPITTDPSVPENIHRLNVIDKSLKHEIGLSNETLLIGKYAFGNNYVTCDIDDEGIFVYHLWDGKKKEVTMDFHYIVELVGLEISYVTDYDNFVEYMNSPDEE